MPILSELGITRRKLMNTCPSEEKPILERAFKDEETHRDEIKYYDPLVQRGSFRLQKGLYRTESEQRAFIEKGATLRLPHAKKPSLFSKILDLLRS